MSAAKKRRGNAGLTHLSASRRPRMVAVGDKAVTHRLAEAEAWLMLPAAVTRALRASGHRTAKGPVFDTAIIAGVLAAKRTAELIPFCHPLPLEHCSIAIAFGTRGRLRVLCRVETHHKTGVEMEALTGASDEELLATIRGCWQARSDRYSELRGKAAPQDGARVEMNHVGG